MLTLGSRRGAGRGQCGGRTVASTVAPSASPLAAPGRRGGWVAGLPARVRSAWDPARSAREGIHALGRQSGAARGYRRARLRGVLASFHLPGCSSQCSQCSMGSKQCSSPAQSCALIKALRPEETLKSPDWNPWIPGSFNTGDPHTKYLPVWTQVSVGPAPEPVPASLREKPSHARCDPVAQQRGPGRPGRAAQSSPTGGCTEEGSWFGLSRERPTAGLGTGISAARFGLIPRRSALILPDWPTWGSERVRTRDPTRRGLSRSRGAPRVVRVRRAGARGGRKKQDRCACARKPGRVVDALRKIGPAPHLRHPPGR